MSVVTSFCGRAISSSQESDSLLSTPPKTLKSHFERSNLGFGPTVRTGKRSVRYWPGGTRAGSMPRCSAWRLPRSPSMREVIATPRRIESPPSACWTHADLNRVKEHHEQMAYVIAEPCIGTKDNSCVEVCPVDCIHPTPEEPDYDKVEMLYIDPDECIDCDACVEACPVDACFAEDQLPDEWQKYAPINADYFKQAG
jgi:NAD-dependent dihydropyrimidine dehydrogenase PreA subunit